MMNKVTIAIAGLAALFVIGATQATPQLQEQSFKVKPGGTLYLRSDSGAIEVESHDKNVVEVDVETSGPNADDFEVEFAQEGNDVRVTGDWDGSYFSQRMKARFIIKIPSQYNVDLKTGGGSIKLDDLQGRVDAHTSGGSIRLGRIQGDVEVDTSGGSIRVEEVAGNINAHTSGGSIRASITKQPSHDCRLSTSGGSVSVELAESIAVDLDARTSGGRVSSDFDVDGKIKRNRIRGTINGGGPDLDLETSGGSVSVYKI